MKYLISIIVSFFIINLISTLGAHFTNSIVYTSDRDNIYPNGYISSICVESDYIYPLLDTGNTGVLKIFKIRMGLKKADQPVIDDSIRWQIYFGSENEYYLQKNHINFTIQDNKIRLALLQKFSDKCKVRIIDLSLDGEILSNSLLDFEFGLDVKLSKLSDNVLVAAFTDKKLSGDEVKVLKFNINNEIINTTSINDESSLLELNNLNVAENGEVAVVTTMPSYDCYSNFKLIVLDKHFNKIIDRKENWNVPLKQIALGRSYDRNWWIEHLYILPIDTATIVTSRTRRAEYTREEVLMQYNLIEDNQATFPNLIFISEPNKKSFFRASNVYRNNNEKCSLESNTINYLYHFRSSQGGASVIQQFPDTANSILTSSLIENDSTYYFACLLKNLRTDIVKIAVHNVIPNVSVRETNTERNTIYSYFSGELARIKTYAESSSNMMNLIVYDFMGNKLMSLDLESNDGEINIPISNLSNGLYLYYIPSLNIKGKFGVAR